MIDKNQSPIEKRAEFKKRMMAQGKLPQEKSDSKQVSNNDVYSPFESWKHYNKK